MTRRRRILFMVVAVLALVVVSAATVLSHDSPCGDPQPLAAGATHMKAIVYRCYGSPDVLKLEQVAKPTPVDDQVLVKVQAASVNPLDWHYMRGKPYIMRLSTGLGAPDDDRMGVDFAGKVEAVGKNVKQFKPGDEVFGGRSGALGEYVVVRESRALALKPQNLSFEQAAAIPVAAITALQALRDQGHVKPGQKVLINGASGGVGTFAVQIAKSLGAEVTGVCSGRNVDLVRSLGADHVLDYTKQDFTQDAERYDVILDNVGNHSLLSLARVLKPDGILVLVGGSSENAWIGPMSRPLQASLLSPFVRPKMLMFLAELNPQDLNWLADQARAGKLTAVIDRRYPLSESPEAIRYLEGGHARGKVIVNVE